MPKQATNPGARWQEKPRLAPAHRQRNFQVVAQTDVRFAIYQRQNLADDADFSCGIRYCPLGSVPIVLARYNGSGHTHGDIVYRPHIHSTTAAAILAGRRPEYEARDRPLHHSGGRAGLPAGGLQCHGNQRSAR